MKTAKEHFKELMTDPVWEAWYDGRPERIKELVQEYPYEIYRVIEGAPFGLTCPGAVVEIVAYSESGKVRVRYLAKDFLPATLEHIKYLCDRHHKDYEIMKLQDIETHIDPVFLEPIG